MRLQWERRGVVRMTVKVEELAALVAGARVAAHALATQPGETTGELERLLDDFDRASRTLQGDSPHTDWFPPGSRTLQDRFRTRPLADRIAEKFLKDHLDDGDTAFVEGADMFFLATADAQGRPSCSYKGGDPGFVTVVDAQTKRHGNDRRQRRSAGRLPGRAVHRTGGDPGRLPELPPLYPPLPAGRALAVRPPGGSARTGAGLEAGELGGRRAAGSYHGRRTPCMLR